LDLQLKLLSVFLEKILGFIFGTNKKGYDVLREILNSPKTKQMEWAKSISTYDNRNLLKEPWQSAFDSMLTNEKFIKIENNAAEYYINNAVSIMKNDLGLETVRGYTLAFDISVNNGSIKDESKKLAINALYGVPNKLTNPNHPDYDVTGLDPKSDEYKRRVANRQVVEDLLKHINGVNDQLLRRCYYMAAAAALQKTKGYSFDSWSRKVAIIEGHGIVHKSETENLLRKVTDIPVADNPPAEIKTPETTKEPDKPEQPAAPKDQNTKGLQYSENYDVNQTEYIIEQKLLKKSQYTRRARRVDTDNPLDSIKAVVVHWVGNTNTTAEANRNYFNNQTVYASSHYIVGLEGEVMQCVPDEECAFHAGGNNYTELAKTQFRDNGVMKHNDWTIGIETCHTDENGNYNSATYTTFVRLTADLLKEYNLSVETGLLRHYDMTGKDCPQLFDGANNKEWEKFKEDVRLAMCR
jgi:N-acetylmuramoyl-L-alanine amidase